MCRVIAISNQKGGVGKTTTTVNLGIGLARQGKKVLLIDADPQGSLTASLGYVEPDEIGTTLATIMMAIINEKEFEITDGILHHKENVDLLPANIELSALEVTMGNVMSRELIMKEYIEAVRTKYDYILIDCMPSLGLMTINALVAADSVLIPVQAAYLPVKGLQQLIHTIAMVKKRLNRKLIFEGILLTMVDFRTNYAKDVAGKVREAYGEKIEIFDTVIPMSVKAAETSAEGVEEIYQLILETVQTEKNMIRIAGEYYPAGFVKGKLLKLNYSHIEYVLECMDKNTTKVRNIKQYLLAALFNAPSTIGSYYKAAVNHDMPQYAN